MPTSLLGVPLDVLLEVIQGMLTEHLLHILAASLYLWSVCGLRGILVVSQKILEKTPPTPNLIPPSLSLSLLFPLLQLNQMTVVC